MKKIVNLIALFLLCVSTAIAGHSQDQKPGFITLDKSSVSLNSSATQIASKIKLPSNCSFQTIGDFTDKMGQTHRTIQITVGGVPLSDGIMKLHFKDGELTSANGYQPKEINIANSSSISKSAAISIACNEYPGATFAWDVAKKQYNGSNSAEAELLLCNTGSEYVYAYRVDVYSVSPLARDYVYVDARSGKIRSTENRLRFGNTNGAATTQYSGAQTITVDSINPTTYVLRDYTRGDSIITMDLAGQFTPGVAVDFTDTDNVWNNVNASKDEYATDAHWATMKYYDYFSTTFSRNSIDGNGMALQSYVHYFTNFDNAFWDGSVVMIGDGDGTNTNPHVSVDILSHEFTHAFIQHTAALDASFEPGALEESFADIFGTIVEFYAKPGSANYTIGEDIHVSGTPMRSLQNPNAYGQPDTYYGTNWATGSNDNGGVHTNGGAQNFWFYLLVNGGTGTNDNGDAYSVTGIGMDKAAEIIYRSITVYMTSSAQYADARAYAIQAANDLYGCGTEVAAVADAWHAVGVGNAFANSAVSADFISDYTTTCHLPASFNFIDQSANAVNYMWYFGDGNTSTNANPQHSYAAVGVYDVALAVSSTGTCGTTTDSIMKIGFINVSGDNGPVNTACAPATTAYCCGRGITNVTVGAIDNTTSNSDGYQDYSCTLSTTVTAGSMTPISVTTGSGGAENVMVWVDYNNDGMYNMTDEMVFQSDAVSGTHSGSFLVAATAPLNTPLRMRVSSDVSSNAITSSCQNMVNGQTEDYTIELIPNTNPPIAGFTIASQLVNIGQTVTFLDQTQNVPTSWSWDITGSSSPTTTAQNPQVSYTAVGVYPVELRAYNAYGADTLLEPTFITVTNAPNLMCTSSGSSAANGEVYDSGGNTANYSSSENCQFLIDVGCVTPITLSFQMMDIESGWDYLYIYDGPTTAAPLLQTFSQSTIPADVVAPSGQMLLVFTSDGIIEQGGFEATWTSAGSATAAPIANITVSDINPGFGVAVDFTDLSANDPGDWTWDFGDANTSTEQNPSHTYAAAGTYPVNVTMSNCMGADMASITVTMQSPPAITVMPDTIWATANVCGDTLYENITITNSGGGDLDYSISYFDQVLDSTNSITYTTTGENTNHVFTGLNDIDSLYVTVTFNGDFDGATETATLFVDGDLIELMEDNNVGNGTDITLSYVFSGAQLAGWIADGTVDIMIDNSNGVNILGATNYHIVRAVGVKSLYEYTGVTAGGNSDVVSVGIPTVGVSNGSYEQQALVASNDPTTPNITIPIMLTVAGSPQIEFSDTCIHYGTIYNGVNYTDSIMVYNTGCDTLRVTNVVPDSSQYLPFLTSFDVAPGDSLNFMVDVNANNIGQLNSDLQFTNNAIDTNVCLTATVVGAPDIAFNVDTLFGTVVGCDDSVQVDLTVYNQGFSDLNVGISATPVAQALFYDGFESGNISTWTDLGGAYTKMATTTNANVGSFNLMMDGGTSSLYDGIMHMFTPSTPANISFRIMSPNTSGFTAIMAFGDANAATTNGLGLMYVSNGGTLQFNATPSASGTFVANTWHTVEIRNIDFTTRTMDYYVDNVLVQAGMVFSDNAMTTIDRVYISGYTNTNQFYLDELTVGGAGGPSITYVTTITPDTTDIPAGDSTIVSIMLDGTGLVSGDYEGVVAVHSNDVGTPDLNIPYVLTVQGVPSMSLDNACLDLGAEMIGLSSQDSVWIYNTGCDSLFLTSLTNDSSQFTLSAATGAIGPDDSLRVDVTFTPDYVGMIADTIWMVNNDVDTFVCLTGEGLGAPAIAFDTDTLKGLVTSCNDSVLVPLWIYNTGQSQLSVGIDNMGIPPALFYEGWESGMSSWTNLSGTYTKQVTSSNQAVGTNSLEIVGGQSALYDGVMHTFTPGTPSNISFRIMSPSTSGFTAIMAFGDANTTGTNGMALMYINNTGTFNCNGSTLFTAPFTPNVWSQVEMRNIDFTAKTFDYYVDGNLIQAGVGMADNGLTNIDRVYISGYSVGNSAYIDEIIIGDGQGVGTSYVTTITPDTADVAVGDSVLINVMLSADGLAAGMYDGTIGIRSNDPGQPNTSFPYELEVQGVPTLELEAACFNFPTTIAGATVNDTMQVYNTGCDTLFLTGYSTATGEFSYIAAVDTVLPGDSTEVIGTFTPSGIGSFSDDLTILNNDATATICLTGDGTGAPAASVNPTVLNVTLSGCDDSTAVPITVYNTGIGDMDYEVVGSFGTPADFAADFESNSIGTWTNLTGTYTKEVTNQTPGGGQYSLRMVGGASNIYDGLMHTFPMSTADYISFKVMSPNATGFTAIMSFGDANVTASNGMALMYINNSGTMTCNGGSLVTGTFTPNTWQQIEMKNIDFTAHTFDYYIDGVMIQAGVAMSDNAMTGVDRVYISGYSAANTCYIDDIIVGTEGLVSSAMFGSINPSTGTLVPGDSSVVQVMINSGGLTAGVYNDSLKVLSNDPVNGSITVPVNITIVDEPCAEYSYNGSVCSGDVTFTDETTNTVTSWDWDFGDGQTSTDQNPVHNYATTGTYLVKLVVCNGAVCDSISYNVSAVNSGSLVAAACSPVSTSPSTTRGITNVKFNAIDHTTAFAATESYQDFTCSQQTNVVEGATYTLSFTTGSEYGYAWIDYNNDGSFSAAEQVYSTTGFVINHTTQVTIPGTAVMNTGLRMRIASSANVLSTACDNPWLGQMEDYTVVITPAQPAPVAAFTYVLDPCTGTVDFTDTSTDDPTSWFWQFGDGTVSGDQNPTHTFANGTYSVTMTATNVGGSSSDVQSVVVNMLDPAFTVSGTLEVNEVITFTDNTPTATGWTWDFGNGTANTSVATNVFTSGGLNNVSLTVQDVNGCTVTLVQSVSITNTEAPIAGFDHAEADPCTRTIQFTDTSLYSPDTWAWQFGDGAVSSDENPSHSYAAPGDYNVSLTVSNAFGSDETVVQVTVENHEAGFTVGGSPFVNMITNFTDTSSPHTVAWSWDFGDLDNSAQQNPAHVYSSVDVFVVTLNITTTAGCVDSEVMQVTITDQAPPVADFNWSIGDTCAHEVNFTDMSLNNPDQFFWAFGDGIISTDQNPTHFYDQAGTFSVSLTATNPYGNDTYVFNVVVLGGAASFDVTGLQAVDEITYFTSTSSGSVVDYEWDFGNGETATGNPTAHIYAAVGDYDVSLVITDQYGCSDTAIVSVQIVAESSIAQLNDNITFDVYPNPSDGNVTIEFSAQFSGAIEVYNGIGQLIKQKRTSSTSRLVDFVGLDAGVYYVKLMTNDGKFGVKQLIVR